MDSVYFTTYSLEREVIDMDEKCRKKNRNGEWMKAESDI